MGENSGSDSDLEDDLKGGKQKMSESDSEDENMEKQKSGIYKAPKLTAVTFEDKKDKKLRQQDEYERKKIGKSRLIEELRKEMRDEPEEVFMGASKKTKANKHEDMVEEMEMENFKRFQISKKEKNLMKKRRLEDMQDKLENLDDDFEAINRIVKRTGNLSSRNNEDADAFESAQRDTASTKFSKSLKSYISHEPKKTKKFSELKSAKIKGDGVYEGEKQRQREKKAARKEIEKKIKENIADEVKDMGEAIQRNVNYNIEKAKGITRKRPKEERNPRVKKRHKYEKMVKAHKTKVQEFAEGKAQPVYKGELGIHTGLKKSTQLN